MTVNPNDLSKFCHSHRGDGFLGGKETGGLNGFLLWNSKSTILKARLC